MDDIIVNKSQSIHRCIDRAREDYAAAGDAFREDYVRQDSAVLNVTRACEQAIDLANHILKSRKMGIPTSSAECFALLARKDVIPRELAKKLDDMVGFRNIAVHEYQTLDLDIVEDVIKSGLNDLLDFTDIIVKKFGKG
ncbi:MAG: DUF86 domain-containing protein [Nitrospirae bacterium]|nr:DUF86 domain-containing protein [Nitrospirota bacterium]